ncbi:MAG: hypothetical protein IPM17_15565 [Verrucomicrobia bacterium]|nr:hypothetical protein [Verrucomicrobiota bacterium]
MFGWVFLTTFPVALPFIFMAQAGPALRVSNGIAVAMLFATGWVFGKITSRSPWMTGVTMVILERRPGRHDHGIGGIR